MSEYNSHKESDAYARDLQRKTTRRKFVAGLFGAAAVAATGGGLIKHGGSPTLDFLEKIKSITPNSSVPKTEIPTETPNIDPDVHPENTAIPSTGVTNSENSVIAENNEELIINSNDEETIRSDEILGDISTDRGKAEATHQPGNVQMLGVEEPFTRDKLKGWLEDIKTHEAEMLNDTYYGTVYIPESLYSSFQNRGEDLSEYLERHKKTLDQLLISSQTESRFNLRRAVVIKDEVADLIGDSVLPFDSDGFMLLSGIDIAGGERSYDPDWDVDKLLLQKWAESFLRLPINNPIDIKTPFHLSEPSPDIPKEWLSFDPGNTDLTADLTGNLKMNLGTYNRMLLKRRVEYNTVHSSEDGVGYPSDCPKTILFSFGEAYNDANFSLMHLTESTLSNGKTGYQLVEPVKKLTDESGNVLLEANELFTEPGLISQQEAVVMLKVNKDGKGYVHWLNLAQHANIAAWLGMESGVRMDMGLAEDGIGKDVFDETVEYSKHELPEMGIDDVVEIDGMLTYGVTRPFTREAIDDLARQFNEMQFNKEDETYYGTMFVSDATYKPFLEENGETFESMIQRHVVRINEMLSVTHK